MHMLSSSPVLTTKEVGISVSLCFCLFCVVLDGGKVARLGKRFDCKPLFHLLYFWGFGVFLYLSGWVSLVLDVGW